MAKQQTISSVLAKMKKNLIQNKDKIIKDTMKEFLNIFEDDVADMMQKAAVAFYNDYTPHMYVRHKRKPTLSHMYHIKVTGTKVEVELGGEFAPNKHRVSNDYIYEKMFKDGWHGGATDNKNPETLYYNKWHGDHWEPFVFEAERMSDNKKKPYEIFMEQYNDYLANKFYQNAEKIFERNILYVLNK